MLPKYKGPNSGAYIIINNERESGSTLHVMTEHVDDGPILAQSLIELDNFDTLRSMQNKVYSTEPELLTTALNLLKTGIEIFPAALNSEFDYLEKRTPSESEIDPQLRLLDLVRFIRACDPDKFPAFFRLEEEVVYIKLWREEKIKNEHPRSL